MEIASEGLQDRIREFMAGKRGPDEVVSQEDGKVFVRYDEVLFGFNQQHGAVLVKFCYQGEPVVLETVPPDKVASIREVPGKFQVDL